MRLHERKNAFTSLILIHFYYLIQLAKFLFTVLFIASFAFVLQMLWAKPIPLRLRVLRLPPGGRDALRKYAGGIFLAKAGSKLCLRPGPKAGAVGD